MIIFFFQFLVSRWQAFLMASVSDVFFWCVSLKSKGRMLNLYDFYLAHITVKGLYASAITHKKEYLTIRPMFFRSKVLDKIRFATTTLMIALTRLLYF